MAQRDYESDSITVHWDSERCVHSGVCLKSLPEVFDLEQRPWVNVNAADADAIAETIERCPSGALRYSRSDGASEEAPPPTTTIRVLPNGPLRVHGDVQLFDRKGDEIERVTRAMLCRCGASNNKPFCDNTHREIGFRDRPDSE